MDHIGRMQKMQRAKSVVQDDHDVMLLHVELLGGLQCVVQRAAHELSHHEQIVHRFVRINV